MSKKSIIAFVAGVVLIAAIPLFFNFIRARSTSAMNACVNNLRQIDSAKYQWALQYNKTTNDTPTWNDLLPFVSRNGTTNDIPICPAGGTYTIGRVGVPPTCSIGGINHSLPQ
jgi:hypothetical protein